MKARLSTEITLLPETAEDKLAAERMLKYRDLKGSNIHLQMIHQF
jgi:hypothetical protein